jgi:hypothetical protein
MRKQQSIIEEHQQHNILLPGCVALQVAYADGFSVLSDVLVEMRTIIDMGNHWHNQVSCRVDYTAE